MKQHISIKMFSECNSLGYRLAMT